MPLTVDLQKFSFTYSAAPRPALEEITGTVEEGASVVVMGRGGAGKSSLCCTMNGVIPHFYRGTATGRSFVRGRDIRRSTVAAMAEMVGLVFQDFEGQLFASTVELEMAFGPENRCLARSEIERRMVRHLRFVGLGDKRKRETATLSGGEKQRLCIASVLICEPAVVVMDEATTDLDPVGRRDVLSLATSLRNEGRTLIMVEDSTETAIHADLVWLMKEGRLVAQGPPRTILADLPLLESCGVGALSPVALFDALHWPGCPLTVEEALTLIDRNRLLPRRPAPRFTNTVSFSGSPILEARGISHRYGATETWALRDVNLRIGPGEFVAILGRNGSGKTTLAKHFNGLLKPSTGTMFVSGRSTAMCKRHELARDVGYVFQNPDHQIFSSTVREEVSFALRVLGVEGGRIEKDVAEALEAVSLTGYEEKSPFLLSRGERQRVAVASVLAIKPRVIVLDEPTTGLDARHQRETMEMLKRLHQAGHTVIMITHAMAIAEAYAQRTVLMQEGRIIGDGPTRQVFADEDLLARASLVPSPLAQLSNRLGLISLSLPGMVEEIKRITP